MARLPCAPVTVFLVRHGSAGLRDDGDPADRDRPLDDGGLDQAKQLTRLLSDVPVVRVLTSPARRCRETIEPVATSHHLVAEPHDDLFEGTPIEASWELLDWAAHVVGDVVLCSHGDVIPELIRRAQLRGMDIPTKSGCAKGSCWTLDHDGTRFVTGRYRKIVAG